MSYTGTTVPIPLGQLGLQTDNAQASIPPNAAIVANNIALYKGVVMKSNGSSRYSSTTLGSPVVGAFDWWPTPTVQRKIAITANGRLWRDSGDGTWSSATNMNVIDTQQVIFSAIPDAGTFKITWGGNDSTAIGVTATASSVQTAVRTIAGLGSATVEGDFTRGFTVNFFGTTGSQAAFTITSNSLTKSAVAVTTAVTKLIAGNTGSLGTFTTDVHFVAGGAETAGNNRRLFIFTGGITQLLMLDGDGSSVTAVPTPAADWTSNYPTFGCIYQGRLIAWGNANARHRLYVSTLGSHANFATSAVDGTGASTFPVFSGEGDGLISGIVYKSSLVLLKKPHGAYLFSWNGGDVSNPGNYSINRFSDSFGLSSPHALCMPEDDLWGGGNSGSVFSLKATNAYGSLEKGDVLRGTKTRDSIRNMVATSGYANQSAIYYPEKQQAMFTYKAANGSTQNLILVVDMAADTYRVSWETKDQPTCLTTYRDSNGIIRPMYGADDGYLYLMDSNTRSVAGSAYTGEFQTPFIDFSFMDGSLADKVKLIDFLQLTYTTTGNWPLYVDVSVDGQFARTLAIQQQASGSLLDSFILDSNVLSAGTFPKLIRVPVGVSGRSVSFRFYNSGLNEYFQIERVVVSFRIGAEQNRSSRG